VVRDVRRRDTAELPGLSAPSRRSAETLDTAALTNLLAIRAVLHTRGVEVPAFDTMTPGSNGV
jgi:hypothetical protein